MTDQLTKVEPQKHSPAPWEMAIYTNYTGYSIFAGDRGCIAERWYDRDQATPYGEEIRANALLIAAAPELLEALKRLMPYFEGEHHPDHPQVKFAHAAIAKAEGKTP